MSKIEEQIADFRRAAAMEPDAHERRRVEIEIMGVEYLWTKLEREPVSIIGGSVSESDLASRIYRLRSFVARIDGLPPTSIRAASQKEIQEAWARQREDSRIRRAKLEELRAGEISQRRAELKSGYLAKKQSRSKSVSKTEKTKSEPISIDPNQLSLF